MPLSRRRKAGSLTRVFPEKTVIVRTGAGSRCLWFSPFAQAAGAAAATAAVLWLVIATGWLALEGVGRAIGPEEQDVSLIAAYDARMGALEAALAEAAAERRAAEERAAAALADLAARHDALTAATTEARALAEANASLAADLARIAAERDEAMAIARDHLTDRATLEAKLGAAVAENGELSDTLIMLAGALDATATARDGAEAAAVEATGALGALEAGVEVERGRQAQLLSEIERAAALSIAPLERMLNASGVDVNRIIDQLRREQGPMDGAGGLFVPLDQGADAGGEDNIVKAVALRDELERLRLLRTAATRMPFAVPVRSPRFTSGFGARRDPFNRRLARHDGLDMAGPVGTPVYTPADGVVVFAGRQGGYGNLITIRHSFGFETKYAHLNRIRVRPGQRIERGERIGDMGNTGRSTGPHLHYEVHVNGRAVDPMKFIKAARHVL